MKALGIPLGLTSASVGIGLWLAWQTSTWLPAAGVGVAAALGWWSLRHPRGEDLSQTLSLAWSPELLGQYRQSLIKEQATLEDALEFQRGVFEVSAELVGCVNEDDARIRFTAALRRYWACSGGDLLVWDQGNWRSLGGVANGPPPELTTSVQLPSETGGDLILDLSAGTAGKGALVLRQARPQPSLGQRSPSEQRQVAEILQGQLALSLRRVLLYTQLRALARIDPLSNTHRRWYGESRLKELLRQGGDIAVALVDIDHFKKFNDIFGHSVGDQVLASVGRCLTEQLRPGDLVCRFGGEEFLVILADADPAAAVLVAERLRGQVAGLADLPAPVTISVGLASWVANEPLYDLVARADGAMYQAKHAGRNRVAVADPPTGEITPRATTTRRYKPTAEPRFPESPLSG